MLLTPSDPDIQTIVTRIHNGDLDLQPDFQRGEVWSIGKKKRLIDSILRNWHVPPIHTVVVPETHRQEVLDGQQRLAAIRDFVADDFTVDGSMPPASDFIKDLGGKTYSQLPENVRRGFDAFTIRMIRITDYAPEEPGELFFRLNQIVNITAAEQRNAFYGPVRQQIKDFVIEFEALGNDQATLGFSNSRMAYDDVLSKLLCTLEARTLNVKLTASVLSDRFRDRHKFDPAIYNVGNETIRTFSKLRSHLAWNPTFNKATLFSWLIFIAVFVQHGSVAFLLSDCPEFMHWFEGMRFEKSRLRHTSIFQVDADAPSPAISISSDTLQDLMSVFNDRSTSRVLDISSVTYRDVVLNATLAVFSGSSAEKFPHSPEKRSQLSRLVRSLMEADEVEKSLEKCVSFDVWGRL
jgi:hypothetical protein